ncbi:two-component system, OmpR family, phosphate regulon sensor histidine kinase PhoR [Polaribacter sp. KT25b]|uniref:sensor histidine kinase n=1 Tax=Polaribacter sp. KT25b TaxID=1855336 RepID=UPI00087B9B63|nr:HAMP domain-containing sensor histidine kinase [Polaribacter sp. KT25b]SDR69388.1 two-component system, OmpR family, phosphate regulon sensor histidine kinase PhoR [Polaribacter sp. KT25b]
MNIKKYKLLFYFITATIVATITVQFYWNYKNYEENKQRVTNEIQLSLDNAIEEYYSSIAKNSFITIIEAINNDEVKKSISINSLDKSLYKNTTTDEKPKITINNIKITSDENTSKEKIDSLMNSAKEFVSTFNTNLDDVKNDSVKFITQFTNHKNGYTLNKDGSKKNITFFKGKKAADSLKVVSNLKPIFISFLDQSVAYQKIDSLIENQLKNKGINLKTSFHHLKNDTLFYQTKDSILDPKTFSVSSKSTYAKENEKFELIYNNTTFETLKRSSLGILLSLLLSLLIISCLFYLLKIINQQKDLAVIKNDLISNITHEFKTPIATVSAAIEAIENFNVLADTEKTKKYLSMSSIQLKKLHQMVEKLLETATLDSEQLLLKKETIDIVEITEKLVKKHKLLNNNKELIFSTNLQPIYVLVDVFHFENAISNLIDNAVKYGGNHIEININSVLKSTEITIADDGNGIEKNQQEKIFDKFYRVSKGNTHDVKGFGIGLYYCKKIIEKHNGTISLSSEKKKTIFKITIPNE